MLLNCGAGEDSWKSLDCKEIKPVNIKESQPWIIIGKTDVEVEAPILWPPDAKSWLIWKGPMLGKIEGGRRRVLQRNGYYRGWDGWMASPIWWAWVWVNSRSWWWTGRPGMLQSVGLQRVGYNWVTELNWKIRMQLASWHCSQTHAYQNYLKSLLKNKTQMTESHPQIFCFSKFEVSLKIHFSISFQVMMPSGPHVENHCFAMGLSCGLHRYDLR